MLWGMNEKITSAKLKDHLANIKHFMEKPSNTPIMLPVVPVPEPRDDSATTSSGHIKRYLASGNVLLGLISKKGALWGQSAQDSIGAIFREWQPNLLQSKIQPESLDLPTIQGWFKPMHATGNLDTSNKKDFLIKISPEG